jgi:molybdopterin-synthase adenylyltransferase
MNDEFSRQSFLGPQAQTLIEAARIGVLGISGGGSHVVQQLAHIGFHRYVLYEPQQIELPNLHRHVGSTRLDIAIEAHKIAIAERVIRGVRPNANIEAYACRWQEHPGPLKRCDAMIGCLDGLQERAELEVLSRRYLIPYVDIGMDVRIVPGELARMSGQCFLSMPGGPCMWCVGLLTKEGLAAEAARYGDAGSNPQVVWPNGILASTAVGIIVDLLTDWTKGLRTVVYFSYDGNRGTLTVHPKLAFAPSICSHYSGHEIGDPAFTPLSVSAP